MPVNKFWKFIKNAATETTPESIELRISGDIIDDDDAWLYEWFGIPCASPNAFRDELSQYAGKDITVWINSNGGSVFAAAGIYNALMEHKKAGAKVTTKVDGKAMSAATIPYMAGDERLMSPVSIFMIHNPLTDAQGYASDLRKAADVLDTVKETIINAYQLGTGLSRAKISSMMDDESYMDAKTAIEQKFATGMLYNDASEPDQNSSILNFAFNRHAILNSADNAIKHLLEFESKNKSKIDKPNSDQSKNGEEETIVDSKELKEKYPEIYNEVFAEGKKEGITEGTTSERERIKGLDDLSGKVDNEFLTKAKYEEPSNAEKVALQAMKEDKMVNTAYLNGIKNDAQNANKVNGTVPPDNNKGEEDATVLSAVKNVADKTIKSLKGVK